LVDRAGENIWRAIRAEIDAEEYLKLEGVPPNDEYSLMKAITLHQPWASLWISGAKIHETRSWRYPHAGKIPDLCGHAAKYLEGAPGPAVDDLCIKLFGMRWRESLPRGSLIGVVNIVKVLTTEELLHSRWQPEGTERARIDYLCGNFDPGRWAWRAAPKPLKFEKPIPYIGRQGMFNVSDSILPPLTVQAGLL